MTVRCKVKNLHPKQTRGLYADKGVGSSLVVKPVMFKPLEEKEVRLIPSVAKHYIDVGQSSGWLITPIDPVPNVTLPPEPGLSVDEEKEEQPVNTSEEVSLPQFWPSAPEVLVDPFAPKVEKSVGKPSKVKKARRS